MEEEVERLKKAFRQLPRLKREEILWLAEWSAKKQRKLKSVN